MYRQTHLSWAQALLRMLPNFTALCMICNKTQTPQTERGISNTGLQLHLGG